MDDWYNLYPGIKGIFIDTVNHDNICYVANMYNYIKSKDSQALVVLNLGTRDPSPALMPYGDILITAEATADEYQNDPWLVPTEAWETDPENSPKIMHIVHDIQDQAQYEQVRDLTRARNAGWVYLTSQVETPATPGSPYNQLSIFSGNYTSDLVSAGGPTTPVIGGMATLPSGCTDAFSLDNETSIEDGVDSDSNNSSDGDSSSDDTLKAPNTGAEPQNNLTNVAFGVFSLIGTVALAVVYRLKLR